MRSSLLFLLASPLLGADALLRHGQKTITSDQEGVEDALDFTMLRGSSDEVDGRHRNLWSWTNLAFELHVCQPDVEVCALGYPENLCKGPLHGCRCCPNCSTKHQQKSSVCKKIASYSSGGGGGGGGGDYGYDDNNANANGGGNGDYGDDYNNGGDVGGDYYYESGNGGGESSYEESEGNTSARQTPSRIFDPMVYVVTGIALLFLVAFIIMRKRRQQAEDDALSKGTDERSLSGSLVGSVAQRMGLISEKEKDDDERSLSGSVARRIGAMAAVAASVSGGSVVSAVQPDEESVGPDFIEMDSVAPSATIKECTSGEVEIEGPVVPSSNYSADAPKTSFVNLNAGVPASIMAHSSNGSVPGSAPIGAGGNSIGGLDDGSVGGFSLSTQNVGGDYAANSVAGGVASAVIEEESDSGSVSEAAMSRARRNIGPKSVHSATASARAGTVAESTRASASVAADHQSFQGSLAEKSESEESSASVSPNGPPKTISVDESSQG